MRVLLTTDGSKQSSDALRAASRLLAPQDREVDVLYVSPEAPRAATQDRLARAIPSAFWHTPGGY